MLQYSTKNSTRLKCERGEEFDMYMNKNEQVIMVI